MQLNSRILHCALEERWLLEQKLGNEALGKIRGYALFSAPLAFPEALYVGRSNIGDREAFMNLAGEKLKYHAFLDLGCRFHLKHFTIHAGETVLFARLTKVEAVSVPLSK